MPQPHAIASRTGETHHEAGAPLWVAFDFDPPAVEIHDAMHRREPEARAFLFRREKRQENLVEILGDDSLSGVLKGDFNDVTLSSSGIDMTRSSGDGQLSAVR